MRRAWPLLVLALLAPGAKADGLDDLVKEEMAKGQVPAVVIAVIKRGQKPDARAYGVANLELGTPATTHHVFRWASLTKQFTSMALHILAAEGKVNLNDSITTALPGAPSHWQKITLAHLASHTSGLLDPGPRFRIDQEYSDAQYLALLAPPPLKAEPGTKYEYCNAGYALLGMVITRASGMPYPDFVKKRILDPAGMKTARFIRSEELVPLRADGYSFRLGEHRNAEDDRAMIYAGSGGLMGSIHDLIAWDAWLRQGGPGEEILAQMRTPFTLADGSQTSYGRGWTLAKWGSSEINGHGGTTFGFTSAMVRDLTQGITIFVLRNVSSGSGPEMARRIYDYTLAHP